MPVNTNSVVYEDHCIIAQKGDLAKLLSPFCQCFVRVKKTGEKQKKGPRLLHPRAHQERGKDSELPVAFTNR